MNSRSIYKITLIGDSYVGKTMISNALNNIPFSEDTFPDNGASMVKFKYNDKTTGQECEIALWDTAGQEKFKSLAPVFYQGSQAAIIVYEVTNKESFQNVSSWRDLYFQYAQQTDHILVIGNKIDLRNSNNHQEDQIDTNQITESQFVTTEEGEEYAREIKADFLEVSAKTGENIEKIMEKMIEYSRSANKTATTISENTDKKSSCC